LFAPDASSTGGMYAPDIAQLDLTGTRVVVLAACDTARGEILRGEGPQSLARPFLAAGAASVIATLWQVDDAASSELFARFHQHLRDSGDPARALQRAQVELLRTGGELARLRAWAGAIAVGAAAPVVTRSTGVQRGAF
jgi:CHAT domain-containing protein